MGQWDTVHRGLAVHRPHAGADKSWSALRVERGDANTSHRRNFALLALAWPLAALLLHRMACWLRGAVVPVRCL
jgi:hypothetical protein